MKLAKRSKMEIFKMGVMLKILTKSIYGFEETFYFLNLAREISGPSGIESPSCFSAVIKTS